MDKLTSLLAVFICTVFLPCNATQANFQLQGIIKATFINQSQIEYISEYDFNYSQDNPLGFHFEPIDEDLLKHTSQQIKDSENTQSIKLSHYAVWLKVFKLQGRQFVGKFELHETFDKKRSVLIYENSITGVVGIENQFNFQYDDLSNLQVKLRLIKPLEMIATNQLTSQINVAK